MWREWAIWNSKRWQGLAVPLRAARKPVIVQEYTAALGDQDRRGKVSAPYEVHTAAYHASRLWASRILKLRAWMQNT